MGERMGGGGGGGERGGGGEYSLPYLHKCTYVCVF